MQYDLRMTPEQLLVFARLVVKHDATIQALAQNAADTSVLLEELLKRCSRCEAAPCTVYNEQLPEYLMCDHCAAELAVKSSKQFTADLEDPVNLLRGSLMREDDWRDLPNADKIRRVMDYVNVLRALDGQQPTVH